MFRSLSFLTLGFESHEPAVLAVSSAGVSLTNPATDAMRAASMAQKPSLSHSPEQVKSSPSHALRAASAADRDSSVTKSPTYHYSPEEEVRFQQLVHEPAKRESNNFPGGVKRSDLTRVATLSMAKKEAFDQ